ncbi:MAG: helix-turn-helix transcriptional regulator [Lachnospiraceae bacterium]|nr:helix-turn-helix transcriptional regulator [Lachnospiraceae bacterium]
MADKNTRLKELRIESKLTQSQLAQYLGVDQNMITGLEDGSESLSISLIEKICNLFGCTDTYLLGEDDTYIPLNFAFRSNGIQTEDLEGIAAINKIAMNLRYMNRMLEDTQ